METDQSLFPKFEFWFFSLWADSREDDASLNVSALDGAGAACVYLSTSHCIKDKKNCTVFKQHELFAKLRKYYAIDHAAYHKLLSHHWIQQISLAMYF